jgi:3-isopropylmalate/(R)-2-methylmalate dehydratase small subunit
MTPAPASFAVIQSRAVPLLTPNIDTNVIIRVDRMMSSDPAALAKWAFESIRYDAAGVPRDDVALNDPEYYGSKILLAGHNFGCGSSREPAVWAMIGLGFHCVIAPSFGDIFAANCLTNGVLPVSLPVDAVEEIANAARRLEEVTVDLPTQEVRLASRSWSFEIGHVHKLMLVEALDEMALALAHLEKVEHWESQDHLERAWAWPQGRHAGMNLGEHSL